MTQPTDPEASTSGLRAFWRRRSRGGKALIIVGALILLFAAIGALADEGDQAGSGDSADARPVTVTVTETETVAVPTDSTTEPVTQPVETAGEEPTEPEPRPAQPIRISGTGARVSTVDIPRDGPIVVGGVHRGSSNFQVELVGTAGADTHEFLFNEIGAYSGEVAVAEVTAGRYRVAVEADGNWTISFRQPRPVTSAKRVPGTVTGRGAKVIQISTTDDMQPVVDATHRGESNFQVTLIGLGDVTGQSFLFNEIGMYSGQALVDEMPTGNYLLAVQADGEWSLKFSP